MYLKVTQEKEKWQSSMWTLVGLVCRYEASHYTRLL